MPYSREDYEESIDPYPKDKPVHSTAAIGAESRVNKYGNELPILHPLRDSSPGYGYDVVHEGKRKGMVVRDLNNWWASSETKPWAGPFMHRHHAVGSLFDIPHKLLDKDMFPQYADENIKRDLGG